MKRKPVYAFYLLLTIASMVSAKLILLPNISFAHCKSEITVKLVLSSTQLSLTVRPLAVEVGQLVFLTARLTDENGAPVEGAKITFKLKNLTGITITGSNGTAMLAFTPQTPGIYEIKAEYAGSSRYSSATETGTMVVLARPDILYLPAIIVPLIAIVAILIIISHKRKVVLQ